MLSDDGAVLSSSEMLINASVGFEQSSTRGDGHVELGEAFNSNEVDFGRVAEHLKIHHDGEVAGGQFNGKLFDSPQALEGFIKGHLPEQIQYDQFGRAEITLDIRLPSAEPIGYSGVISLEELSTKFPNAKLEKQVRIPGGLEATEDGMEGAWYPEMAFDAQEGRMKVAMEGDRPKNPQGKFEPKANIVTVSADRFQETSTNKVTLIIQKNRTSGAPSLLTVFPGENAPAFPAKMNSKSYKADTLNDPLQAGFWNKHAFIKTVSNAPL